MTFGVNTFLAFDLFLSNGDYLPVFDTDIAHRIQFTLRIHDPATDDDQVIYFSRIRSRRRNHTHPDH